MTSAISRLYCAIFGTITRITEGWFIGLAARLVFLAVLFSYYMNSFSTKVGKGFGGFFQIQDGAYFQIVPAAMEASGYEIENVSLLAHLMVFFGTYMELILPILIVVGLLTRASALGMIGFIGVQTLVDIKFHGVDQKTIGAWFDRFPDAVIWDQRSLWVFLLIVLVIEGGGYLSLDNLLGRKRGIEAFINTNEQTNTGDQLTARISSTCLEFYLLALVLISPSTTLPLPLMAILRGFMASGISRTRSICNSPFSSEAPRTST